MFTFQAKWSIFISTSGQHFIPVCMIMEMVQSEMKVIARVISLWSFWLEWNFVSGDKISSKHYPKRNHMKGNICLYICFLKTRMIGFYWRGRFSWITLEKKFHFISPTMKSNVNNFLWWVKISFRVSCKHPLNLLNSSFMIVFSTWKPACLCTRKVYKL